MPKELPVDRKYKLMILDPLVKTYVEKHKQWRKNCFDETLTQEVEQLQKQIKDKWNARLHWPESTIQGVTDFWMLVREPYKAVEDARVRGTMIIPVEKDGLNLRKMIFASFQDNGLIHCAPHKIPIIIDPTILTLHDGETVKEEVWNIVKAEIGKQKKTINGREFAVPSKEPEGLAAVFRCKSEKFEKYLRWYGLKIEEGLTFRLIALIEFHSKPEDREQKFEEHISRKKKVRNIGPVEEEDTVRKGVGLIYKAIFRKPMSARESHIPTLKEYNCPYHSWNPNTQEWDCDADCEYLKSYSARLSRF